jgi:hypothetical protein
VHPGKGEAEPDHPFGREDDAANQELFGKWVAQLPQPAASAAIKSWRSNKSANVNIKPKLIGPAREKIQMLQWFPFLPRALAWKMHKPNRRETSLSFRSRLFQSLKIR